MTAGGGQDGYTAWVEAGLTHPDGSGLLERRLKSWAGYCIHTPRRIWIADSHLHWDDLAAGRTKSGPDLLGDFVALAADDAGEDDVLRFAERWGPLWLCPVCLRPWDHPSVLREPYPAERTYPARAPCTGLPGDPFSTLEPEPLVMWRTYAQRARAILDLSARYIRDDREGLLEDWARLLAASEGSPYLELARHLHETHISACDPRASPAEGTSKLCSADKHVHCSECGLPACWAMSLSWFELGVAVDEWLWLTGARMRISWLLPDRPGELLFGGDEGLLGEIGVQLALAITRADNLSMCADCGRPFAPPRRSATGRRAFCPACGTKAARRHASRDYRARKQLGLEAFKTPE